MPFLRRPRAHLVVRLVHARSSRLSPPSMLVAAGDGVRLPEAVRRQVFFAWRAVVATVILYHC